MEPQARAEIDRAEGAQFAVPACDETLSLEDAYLNAAELLQNNQAADALPFCVKAVTLAELQPAGGEDLIDCLHQLGRASLRSGDAAEAEKAVARALKVCLQEAVPPLRHLARLYSFMADIQYCLEEPASAMQVARQALGYWEQVRDEAPFEEILACARAACIAAACDADPSEFIERAHALASRAEQTPLPGCDREWFSVASHLLQSEWHEEAQRWLLKGIEYQKSWGTFRPERAITNAVNFANICAVDSAIEIAGSTLDHLLPDIRALPADAAGIPIVILAASEYANAGRLETARRLLSELATRLDPHDDNGLKSRVWIELAQHNSSSGRRSETAQCAWRALRLLSGPHFAEVRSLVRAPQDVLTPMAFAEALLNIRGDAPHLAALLEGVEVLSTVMRYDIALTLLQRIYAAHVLRPEHVPATARVGVASKLAAFCIDLEQERGAGHYLDNVFAIIEDAGLQSTGEHALALHYRGRLSARQGLHRQALADFAKGIEVIMEQSHSLNAVLLASLFVDSAETAQALSEWDDALEFYHEAVRILEEAGSATHPRMLQALEGMAGLYDALHDEENGDRVKGQIDIYRENCREVNTRERDAE